MFLARLTDAAARSVPRRAAVVATRPGCGPAEGNRAAVARPERHEALQPEITAAGLPSLRVNGAALSGAHDTGLFLSVRAPDSTVTACSVFIVNFPREARSCFIPCLA